MMKKIFYLAGILLAMISCKKESTETNQTKATSDYLPLAIGNYWVYETFEIIDGKKNVFETDSLVITGDTTMWGGKYFRVETYRKNPYDNHSRYSLPGISYKRDSSKYLVDSYGRTLFSETNLTDTLLWKIEKPNNDTIYIATYKMDKPANLPGYLDTFKNVLSFTGTITPKMGQNKAPLYVHLYYAKGIGEVAQNYYYFFSRSEVIKVLVRYKVY